jgi:hypothetical protein
MTHTEFWARMEAVSSATTSNGSLSFLTSVIARPVPRGEGELPLPHNAHPPAMPQPQIRTHIVFAWFQPGTEGTMRDDKTGSPPKDERKARLAEQLRANLQKRKAQARARRSGEADSRPDGLAASGKPAK